MKTWEVCEQATIVRTSTAVIDAKTKEEAEQIFNGMPDDKKVINEKLQWSEAFVSEVRGQS